MNSNYSVPIFYQSYDCHTLRAARALNSSMHTLGSQYILSCHSTILVNFRKLLSSELWPTFGRLFICYDCIKGFADKQFMTIRLKYSKSTALLFEVEDLLDKFNFGIYCPNYAKFRLKCLTISECPMASFTSCL